jgi:hypothetical protein
MPWGVRGSGTTAKCPAPTTRSPTRRSPRLCVPSWRRATRPSTRGISPARSSQRCAPRAAGSRRRTWSPTRSTNGLRSRAPPSATGGSRRPPRARGGTRSSLRWGSSRGGGRAPMRPPGRRASCCTPLRRPCAGPSSIGGATSATRGSWTCPWRGCSLRSGRGRARPCSMPARRAIPSPTTCPSTAGKGRRARRHPGVAPRTCASSTPRATWRV